MNGVGQNVAHIGCQYGPQNQQLLLFVRNLLSVDAILTRDVGGTVNAGGVICYAQLFVIVVSSYLISATPRCNYTDLLNC